MRRKPHSSLWIGLAAAAAVVLLFVLLKQAPPEAARLLPESDAIVYVHLKTVRSLKYFETHPVSRSPDYQKFIAATGIDPERDLDALAFALHRMPDAHGANGGVAYSEVFTGRFDGMRLAKYLASVASSTEKYAGHDVYSIPVEGRTLRVAQLGYDTVGASNMPTAEQIHSMLDRHRRAALWTPGSSLLAARYHEVPLLSQAWAIGHVGLPFSQNGHIALLGVELPLREDTDLVASLRYSGAVHLRVEEIAQTPEDAQHTVEALGTVLNFLRNVQSAAPANPGNEAMHALLGSVTLEQHKNRAVLTLAASNEALRALTASSNAAPAVAPEPARIAAPPANPPGSAARTRRGAASSAAGR